MMIPSSVRKLRRAWRGSPGTLAAQLGQAHGSARAWGFAGFLRLLPLDRVAGLQAAQRAEGPVTIVSPP